MKKWKLIVATLGLCFLVGCSGSDAPADNESGSKDAVTQSAADAGASESASDAEVAEGASDGTDSTKETTPEKTKLETILELKDEKEKNVQLYELMLENPDDLDVTLAFLRQAIDYDFELSTVPEAFRKEQKSANNDKIKAHQCQYAQYTYDTEDHGEKFMKRDKTKYQSIFCFDENGMVTYAPVQYGYFPSFDLDGYNPRDVEYHYDESGNWISTDRLEYNSYSDDWTNQVHDEAVYDKNGRLVKVYAGGELCKEYQYNNDGLLTQNKWYGWNEIYKYQYDKNGFLSTETYYFDGQKEDEQTYAEEDYLVQYTIGGPLFTGHDFRCYTETLIVYYVDGTENYRSPWKSNNPLSPDAFTNYKVSVLKKDYDKSVYLLINVSNQYGDGFTDVNTFGVNVYNNGEMLIMNDYDYTLFYVPE